MPTVSIAPVNFEDFAEESVFVRILALSKKVATAHEENAIHKNALVVKLNESACQVFARVALLSRINRKLTNAAITL
jgi:hypothetical protein